MTTFTKEGLQDLNKETLISLLLNTQEQLIQLNKNFERLAEQVKLSNQRRFGRSSEKLALDNQLTLEEVFSEAFNEAEKTVETLSVTEPELETIVPKPYRRKKQVGKREDDLKDIETVIIKHELSDGELKAYFPDKYRQLPDDVYKRLAFYPARFEVEEHHVSVYAGSDDKIIRADRPPDLLRNSILTPTLGAAIINAKYVLSIPIYRLAQEFLRNEINLSRQTMSSWVIKLAERYLSLIYERLIQHLCECDVVHADETPFLVNKDGRKANSNSYMWLYKTGDMVADKIAVVFEYQRTRKAEHPIEFLSEFHDGVLVADGYSVYKTLLNTREDITLAGCWAHARRPFSELVKANGTNESKGTLAYQALQQIQAIYKLESKLGDKSKEEREQARQLTIKPLVEAYFEWVKANVSSVMPKSATGTGFTYSINQEEYLKVFLDNGNVPIDNSSAERAIRPFCIGKKNWVMVDSIDGAKSSAIIYSITETAKANKLKPYEYINHLLTVMPEHMDDKSTDFIEDLLPWSKKLPQECRSTRV